MCATTIRSRALPIYPRPPTSMCVSVCCACSRQQPPARTTYRARGERVVDCRRSQIAMCRDCVRARFGSLSVYTHTHTHPTMTRAAKSGQCLVVLHRCRCTPKAKQSENGEAVTRADCRTRYALSVSCTRFHFVPSPLLLPDSPCPDSRLLVRASVEGKDETRPDQSQPYPSTPHTKKKSVGMRSEMEESGQRCCMWRRIWACVCLYCCTLRTLCVSLSSPAPPFRCRCPHWT